MADPTDKPEIEKLRVLHDLRTQFDVPEAIRNTLEAQLSTSDQGRVERFVSGFRIEDWFEWIFSALPWVRLIHGLDQQQFPARSKENYQVPDFMLFVETTELAHRPLLVEVKRVPSDKSALKLQESQVALCENYAAGLQIPLVYAVYWEQLSAWTLNTPDTFERKTSSRKLPMASAFGADCGQILGDVSHMLFPSLVRTSRFSPQGRADCHIRHPEYGFLVSDVAVSEDRRVEMDSRESAALDAMLSMRRLSRTHLDNGGIELTESPDSVHLLKLSSWITRHLALFNLQPSEGYANVSAHIIMDLMNKLDCPLVPVFPHDRSGQVDRLSELFLAPK